MSSEKHWLLRLPEAGLGNKHYAEDIEFKQAQIADTEQKLCGLRGELKELEEEAERYARHYWSAEEITEARSET